MNDTLKQIFKQSLDNTKKIVDAGEENFIKRQELAIIQQQLNAVILHNVQNGKLEVPQQLVDFMKTKEEEWKKQFKANVDAAEALKEVVEKE